MRDPVWYFRALDFTFKHVWALWWCLLAGWILTLAVIAALGG